MKQLYVCTKCDNKWEESFLEKVYRCPKCGSDNFIGARYGVGCACKGKVASPDSQRKK